ncbi:MAG: GtrA family protein [Micromonosporaceae bacterium]|nr:GtrA family protein [Micromonosporaceae bacterium]
MWLTSLYARFRDLVHELGKFGIVGGAAYLVDTALFAMLLATLEPLTAKAVAAVIAATVAFVGNRFWTWRHRARSGLAREYLLYFTFNGVGLAISLVILWVTHYLLGTIWPVLQTPLADLISANVVGLLAGTSFRFWSYRRFVFREHASGSEELSHAHASGSDKLSRVHPSGDGLGADLAEPPPPGAAPGAVAPARRGGVA